MDLIGGGKSEVSGANCVEMLDIDAIKPIRHNPFHLYEGERLSDMVESIKEHGILTPVIVRKMHYGFRSYMQKDFLQKMHSIAFRVMKGECLDLPEIIEDVREVELDPKAMKMYQEIEKESYTELRNSEVSAVNVLTKLLRLSQLTGGHLTDDDGDCNAVSTAKLALLRIS